MNTHTHIATLAYSTPYTTYPATYPTLTYSTPLLAIRTGVAHSRLAVTEESPDVQPSRLASNDPNQTKEANESEKRPTVTATTLDFSHPEVSEKPEEEEVGTTEEHATITETTPETITEQDEQEYEQANTNTEENSNDVQDEEAPPGTEPLLQSNQNFLTSPNVFNVEFVEIIMFAARVLPKRLKTAERSVPSFFAFTPGSLNKIMCSKVVR